MALGDQGACHRHGVVESRHTECAKVGVQPVIQDVDTATKRPLPIDHTQFAVQTPPPAGNQHPRVAEGCVAVPLHSTLAPTIHPMGGQIGGAHTIHHHKYRNPTLRCAGQGLGHIGTLAIEIKNVGLQSHLVLGGVDSPHQRRKKLITATQQMQHMA